ncbi:hypothetical protein BDN72DRAFT_844357 [Pluteus cervinus]|uniref:Uncharacterized protein n=1 Tax=Pluteus cervinus TaxID=181527 RepID=A0ACD3ANC8_9AGAR|nr:hypothetical protein BDN72DRAFT_844357 [Pluteus cervinus]
MVALKSVDTAPLDQVESVPTRTRSEGLTLHDLHVLLLRLQLQSNHLASEVEQVTGVANEANLRAEEAAIRATLSEERLNDVLQQLKSKSEEPTSTLLASQLRRTEDDLASVNSTLSNTKLELEEVQKQVQIERARADDAERKLVECVVDGSQTRKSTFIGWGVDVEKQRMKDGFVWRRSGECLPTTSSEGYYARWSPCVGTSLWSGVVSGYQLGGKESVGLLECSSNV